MIRTVEIKTTQNVVIEYELAGASSRFVAFAFDVFVLLLLSTCLNFIAHFIDVEALSLPFTLLIAIFSAFYTLFFEMFMKGQTPGKKAVGLRVIKTDGGELTFKEYFTRWAFRFADIFLSLGTLAILTINGSKLGQRVGDMAAGTTVIKIKGMRGFSLSQILTLGNRENYTPLHAGVRNLKEEDVLLIKNALSRFTKYGGSAYRELIQSLFDKVAPFLDSDILPTKPTLTQKVTTLRQVVSDYIVLTR